MKRNSNIRGPIMQEKVCEENLTVMLAELLAESGIKAIGQPIVRKKVQYILLYINGVRIILEGQCAGKSVRKELYKKACERIDDGMCEVVMMVEYVKISQGNQEQIHPHQKEIKKVLRESLFNVGFVTYVNRIESNIPELSKELSLELRENVDFKELVASLMLVYDSIIKENVLDSVIEKMEEKISLFSEKIMVDNPNIEQLKKVLELTEEEEIKVKDKLKNKLKILATSALLLMDAMIFQEILVRKDSHIKSLSSIQSCENIKGELEDTWSCILKKGYEPIFKIAHNILRTLPASHTVQEGLGDLITVSLSIASSPVLLKHDLFGRIYHKLLLGKLVKYYATLYTSLPAARLLAGLLLNPTTLREKDTENIEVVDFACGSGTLLSAVYKEMELKYRLETEEVHIDDFHKHAIEDVLWGFDVLQHATHLTMTTLSLHNPFPVESSRIYTVKLGVESKDHHVGSIQFLTTSELKATELLSGGKMGALRVTEKGKEVTGVTIPDFHICIMNPPFTRSALGNLLFGGVPPVERKKLQNYLSNMLTNQGLSGIGQAGSAALFVFVADKHLLKGGRMGIVVPRSILSGTSWKKVREKLRNEYHVEYVVISFEGDDNQWNFSENTSLSEVLLIARKLKEGELPGYTIFVNLWKKSRNEIESISIVNQLLEMYNIPKLFDISNSNASTFSLRLSGKKIGECYSTFLEDTEFGCRSFFAQSELDRVLSLLRNEVVYSPKEGIIKHISLCPLSEVVTDIGPDCGQISKTFEMDSLGVYKGFWGQRSDDIHTIFQRPNTNLSAKNAKAARNLWKKSGNFLLAYRAWLPKNRTLSLLVSEPVVSSMWWNIITDEESAKMLALWLNSTYGLLLLLSVAEVTRGPWIEFKKGDKEEKTGLWGLPVINLNKLSEEQKRNLLNLYESVADRSFLPFPEEFSHPQVRKEIDEGMKRILGIEVDLSDIYEMLCRDPMITGLSLK